MRISNMRATAMAATGSASRSQPLPNNRFYLETKAVKSGHLIDFRGKAHLVEQIDRPIVEGMTAEQIAGLEEQ